MYIGYKDFIKNKNLKQKLITFINSLLFNTKLHYHKLE